MNTEKKNRINHEIRVPKVRLIDAEGQQVGIVSSDEALRTAQQSGLDLVEISPNASPPVCRIMNFGKFQFQLNKQRAIARKKQHVVHIKELKFRPTIEDGDYQVKLRNLLRFLEDGDKVKITLRYRGREMSHQEFGLRVIERLQKDLTDLAVVEQTPKLEGRQMTMVVSPKKLAGGKVTSPSTPNE